MKKDWEHRPVSIIHRIQLQQMHKIFDSFEIFDEYRKDKKNPVPKPPQVMAWILFVVIKNNMETQFKLNKPWERVKETLKEINVDLTDEDLVYTPGEEDQLLERLEKKMNKSKAEIKALIESISANKGKAS